MHASAGRDPAQSHLRDTTRGAGFPRRLGSQPDGCSNQRTRDQIFVVALSRWRAPVDRARHGGLRSKTIYLGGREMTAMFPSCRWGGSRRDYCALAAAHVATTTALKTSKDCKLTRHRVAESGVIVRVCPAATVCDLPLILSKTLSLAGGPTIPTVKCPSPRINV